MVCISLNGLKAFYSDVTKMELQWLYFSDEVAEFNFILPSSVIKIECIYRSSLGHHPYTIIDENENDIWARVLFFIPEVELDYGKVPIERIELEQLIDKSLTKWDLKYLKDLLYSYAMKELANLLDT